MKKIRWHKKEREGDDNVIQGREGRGRGSDPTKFIFSPVTKDLPRINLSHSL